MRRLLALALFMLAAPSWAAQYYVRTDGNDTLCNGQTDAAAGVVTCAFATAQKAFTTFVAGDDIMFKSGTFTGPAVKTANMCATSGNPSIIEGDPGAAVSAVVLDDNNVDNILMSFTGTVCNVKVRHLTIKGAKQILLNMSLVGNTSQKTDVEITDIDFNDAGGTLHHVRATGSDTGYALFMSRLYRSRIHHNTFTGATGGSATTAQGMTGSDASLMFLAGNDFGASLGTQVDNNTGANWLGAFVREGAAYSIIEDNWIDNILGSGDDGMDQVYNDHKIIFRRNRMTNVCNDQNITGGVVHMRSTPHSQASTPGSCGQPTCCTATEWASAEMYNNTITLSANCGSGSQRRGLGRSNVQCEVGALNGPITIMGNVFQGAFGINGAAAVMYPNVSQTTTTNLCPASPNVISIDHNFIFGATTATAVGTSVISDCTFRDGMVPSTTAGDFDVVGTDPELDGTTYAPTNASNAVCTAGDSTYVARDGDHADVWAGALQGVCSGGAPPPTSTPAVKLYGAIIKGSKFP